MTIRRTRCSDGRRLPAAPADGGGCDRREATAGGRRRAVRRARPVGARPGDRIAAETIVEQEDATVVVPAGWSGAVAGNGTLLLERTPMTDPVTQDILANALRRHRRGDGRRRVPVVVLADHPRDARLQLRRSSTRKGRMVTHSEQIPAQLGLMQFALQAALAQVGRRRPRGRRDPDEPSLHGWHPHPRPAGLHARASTTARSSGYRARSPTTSTSAGRVPGTEAADNTELFQEGLIFPAVKLVERGVRSRALYDLVAANVRDPHSTVGDLDGQLAACKRGVVAHPGACGRQRRGTGLARRCSA